MTHKTTPAFIDVLKALLRYVTDLRYIFHKDFIKERYYLHFFCSLGITFIFIYLLFLYAHLGETQLILQLFVGGFSAFFVNAAREDHLEWRDGNKLDWTDCNMGSYAGVLAAYLVHLIF